MGTMRNTGDQDAILQTPLITPDTLARALNIGSRMLKTAARRAGMQPTRMPNNRDYFSPAQAIAVRRELLRRVAG